MKKKYKWIIAILLIIAIIAFQTYLLSTDFAQYASLIGFIISLPVSLYVVKLIYS